MSSGTRAAVASLVLSAAAFVGIVTSEDFTDRAVIPTRNDKPTVGFGSTSYENGAPVKMGDVIKPVRAVQLAAAHLSKEEIRFRASLPDVKLYQAEYDLYMDWVYQYGSGAWSKSSMRRDLLAGSYTKACNDLLFYKFSGGYDCTIPGNKVCAGVWTRQLKRHKTCMEAQ
jgi:lysozyme